MKYLKLMRVRHWIKNFLIFFPIVFSGRLFKMSICLRVSIGFLVFSLTASFIYIFNDMRDMERDKKMEGGGKRNRPLASGAVSKQGAVLMMGIIAVTILVLFYFNNLGWKFWCCIGCYLFMNIAYSMGMKNIPIIDIVILSSGYLLRLYGGGELAGVRISDWMFLTVMAASFYLGFGKRRNELLQYGDKGRKTLERYTVEFLDKGVQMFLTLTVVFYSLCCADKNTDVARRGVHLLWSVFVVILVLLRYNLLLENRVGDGDPMEVLWQDKIVVCLILFYAVSVLLLIYK